MLYIILGLIWMVASGMLYIGLLAYSKERNFKLAIATLLLIPGSLVILVTLLSGMFVFKCFDWFILKMSNWIDK